MGEDINEFPKLDAEKCTGCGICVASCPGLAIFLLNRDFGDGRVEIGIPYELIPLPEKGDTVLAVSREGEVLCEAEVTKVRTSKAFDRTAVVYIAVPEEHTDSARFFVAKDAAKPPLVRQNPNTGETDVVLCRCEDIYQSEIEALIDEGYETFDELKRILRCGMGPCQGKTCQRLVLGVLARRLGKRTTELQPQTTRSPVRPVDLGVFADSDAQWNLADWPEKRPGGK
jgi:ferredoxin